MSISPEGFSIVAKDAALMTRRLIKVCMPVDRRV